MLKNTFNALRQILGSINRRKSQQMDESKLWIHYDFNPNGQPRIHGNFVYRWQADGPNNGAMKREFNFVRTLTEPVADTLHRLQYNVWNHSKPLSDRQKLNQHKKQKAKGKDEQVEQGKINSLATLSIMLAKSRVSISLYDHKGSKIHGDIPNREAWIQGGKLQVNDLVYTIELNAPKVVDLTLPNLLLANFGIFPYLTLESAEPSHCEFKWLRLDAEDNAVLLSCDEVYTPSSEDVGHVLKLVVVPKNGDRVGKPVEVVSRQQVINSSQLPSITARQQYTVQESSAQRVVSYNILAEVYTNTDFSRHELFSHCPVEYLEYDYRKQIITKELLGYKSDIICLQEVDQKHFTHYYQPLFSKHGYQSEILAKRHQKIRRDWFSEEKSDEETNEDPVTVVEGSAVFFKTSKFRQIGSHNVNISEIIENDPLFTDIMETARSCKVAVEKLIYRSGTSLQVVVLELIDNPSRRVCVCTTHLYFHPLATVVRLLQLAVAMRYMQFIKCQYATEGRHVSALFAGDFNMTPDSKGIRFILQRYINKADQVWKETPLYTLSGMELKHDFNLASACGFPKFTNYVPKFQECIDYIFYEQDRLQVQSVVPLPSEQALTAHGEGIPNKEFPSDHVPLICEFTWK